MHLLLIASSGGHLQHLWWLAPWWSAHDRTWVTFRTPDAEARLAGEDVVWAHHPTTRHLGNLARNARLAWAVTGRVQPDLAVSTGAGVALPFLAAARARGIPTVFCEVMDRVDRPSLTGRLVAPWVDAVALPRPSTARAYRGAVVVGAYR